MKYILIAISFAIFFTGCAEKLTVNYSPSSTMIVKGNVNVGDFKYYPMQKFDIKPNQIRNTALGSIILEKNINEFFKDAIFNESRLVGIKVDGKNKLDGEINDFLIDDLGYSIDWTLDVKYNVMKDGKLCYSKNKVLQKNTSKFINFFGTLNEIVKLNIEQLFNDKEFVKCIN